MDIQRVYLKFTDRINSLTSNYNKQVGGLREFVDCFNEAQNKVIQSAITVDEANDSLQELLSPLLKDYETVGINTGRKYLYTLPDDFEHFKGAVVDAVKGTCRAKLIARLRKVGLETHYYADAFYRPSFEWEETFCTLGDNKLRVFVTDFELEKLYLTYYKKPTLVSIEGLTDMDGNPTTNINSDFDGRHLEVILDMAAQIYLRNTGDERMNLFA